MVTRLVVALTGVLALGAATAAGAPPAEDAVRIRVVPGKVFREFDGVETSVFFHVVVENRGETKLTLDRYVERFATAGEPEVRTLEGDELARAVRGGKVALEPGERTALLSRHLRRRGDVAVERATLEVGGARLEVPVKDYAQRNRYRLPFARTMLCAVGHAPNDHHRLAADGQSFAWDIFTVDEEGSAYRAIERGARPTKGDALYFGEPILAPADGTVVRAKDGRPDIDPTPFAPFARGLPEGETDRTVILGNFVVIEHAGGEHSLLAHLREGSIRVREGQRVRVGEPVAEGGNSGNTTQPHLHFQVMDGPDHFTAAGLPVRLDRHERTRRGETTVVPNGIPRSGDRIGPAPW